MRKNRRLIELATLLLLAGGGTVVNPGAAAAHPTSRAESGRVTSGAEPPVINDVRLDRWNVRKNGNSRSRCDDANGQSYVTVDYNAGRARPRYDIVVRLKNEPPEHFASWDAYDKSPDLWKSWTLYGPGSPGRGGYFALGKRGFGDEINGTIGVEIYRMGTFELVGWSKWAFPLGCGRDYDFWFENP